LGIEAAATIYLVVVVPVIEKNEKGGKVMNRISRLHVLSVACVLLVAMLCAADSKVSSFKTDEVNYSAWRGNATCGGLSAEVWSDSKGWHKADCMEMAEKLGSLRDVRSVSVQWGPDVPSMLAYVQYEDNFRIRRADFLEAKEQCRKVLKDGYAHPDVISHCKTVVAGVVPYGLKLK
jgi:hypothetical protein